MALGFKNITKKLFACVVCAASAVQMIHSAIPIAHSKGSSEILGTNTALGSPLLNPTNFDNQDWNPWETICWGVYLSNFCQPLVDTYETAFNENSKKGSRGYGYRALWGGSGSDAANKEIIRGLCEYACDVQTQSIEPIYTRHYWMDNGTINTLYLDGQMIKDKMPLKEETSEWKISNDSTPKEMDDSADCRPATFQDLWLVDAGMSTKKGDPYETEEAYKNKYTDGNNQFSPLGDTSYFSITYKDSHTRVGDCVTYTYGDEQQYDATATACYANLPVFYVDRLEYSTPAMITVFDMTDWWDVQIPSMIANSVRTETKDASVGLNLGEGDTSTDTFKSEFNENFAKLWDSNAPLYFDSFGNIVSVLDGEYVMVIPASLNQHITGQPSINLLNSWMFNRSSGSVDKSSAIEKIKCALNFQKQLLQHFIGKEEQYDFRDSNSMNGFPALGDCDEAELKGKGFFYYDTDSAILKRYYHGEFYTETFGDLEYDDASYGSALLETFDQCATASTFCDRLPLKFELAGIGPANSPVWGWTHKGEDSEFSKTFPIASSVMGSSMLVNQLFIPTNSETYYTTQLAMDPNRKKILTSVLTPEGTKLNILDENNVIAIPVKVNKSSKRSDTEAALRHFYNWLLQTYLNPAGTGLNRTGVTEIVGKATVNDFLDSIVNGCITYFGSDKMYASKYSTSFNDKGAVGWNLEGKSADWATFFDCGNNETFTINTARVVKVYVPSEVSQSAAQILGNADGAEFSMYSSWLYMTYLDFYGVLSSKEIKNGVTNTSNFDSVLFMYDVPSSEASIAKSDVAIQDFTKGMYDYDVNTASNKTLEEEVLGYSYLMLEPTSGREYRQSIINSSMEQWMLDQYNRTVYGGSKNYAGTTSKAKSGFLSIETFDENFLTSWFLENYVDIVVWLIMISILIIIILGLLKSRKISWFLITIVMTVNIFLLAPSTGEILPYATSKVTNKMFGDKMTYWSIAQGISNSDLEYDARKSIKEFEGLNQNDKEVLLKIIEDLGVNYTDSNLSVKQDISQKVTQYTAEGTVWDNVEYYQSARWVLPMVMQQFTADDGSANYIYKPLANVWTDMSNVYWYFNPYDATVVNTIHPTISSGADSSTLRAPKETANESESAKHNTAEADEDNPYSLDSPYTVYQWLANDKKTVFPDYKLINTGNRQQFWYNDDGVKVTQNGTYGKSGEEIYNYRCYSYSVKEASKQAHVILPYLDNVRKPVSRSEVFKDDYSNYSDVDSWKLYIDYATNKQSGVKNVETWKTDYAGTEAKSNIENGKLNGNTAEVIRSIQQFWAEQIGNSFAGTTSKNESNILGFEYTADTYVRRKRSTFMPDMPYLLSTESPIYYFYAVVKDSLGSEISIAQLVNQLQGAVKEEDGKLIRDNFMFATISKSSGDESSSSDTMENRTTATGNVRDVLDLEEMFYNTIPYLYQMTIQTGGFDGTSGILGDATISDELNYYEGEYQSWMYRCNWATKIMENPNFSEPAKVRDKDGKTIEIKCPVLPDSYPENRPMVFSYAQMEAQGLTEKDLNIVELKCCKVNKDVTKQWTLLVNYLKTDGITKEVIYRQMATDATLIFNAEFSSAGIIDTKYELYPQSLDLRYLSFDAIAKIIMLNVSNDTSYAYGNAMQNLVSDSDILTSVLLLITAWCCAFMVPLFRTFLMALIFYLGFWAVLKGIFCDNKTKANMGLAQLVTNILFALYTIIFYGVFWFLMAVTTKDEVLSYQNVKAQAGNPVWVLIVMLVASIAYMVVMFKHIKFCIQNRHDMGFEAYSTMASGIVAGVSGAVGRAGAAVSSFFKGGSESVEGTPSGGVTNNLKGTGISNENNNTTNSSSSSVTAVSSTSSTANNIAQTTNNPNIAANNGMQAYVSQNDITNVSTGETYNNVNDINNISNNTVSQSNELTANEINQMIDEGSRMNDGGSTSSNT